MIESEDLKEPGGSAFLELADRAGVLVRGPEVMAPQYRPPRGRPAPSVIVRWLTAVCADQK
jgi:hypothetical protein